MSSSMFYSLIHHEIYEYHDNELDGWFHKLRCELAEESAFRQAINALSIRKENLDRYVRLENAMLSTFQVVDNYYNALNIKIENKDESLLSQKEVNNLIDALGSFNFALIEWKNFIEKDMYKHNKIEYLFVKIQGILSAIINFFLNRHLKAERSVYGEGFYASFKGPLMYQSRVWTTVFGKADEVAFFAGQMFIEVTKQIPSSVDSSMDREDLSGHNATSLAQEEQSNQDVDKSNTRTLAA